MLLSWQKGLCKCDEGHTPWDENIIQKFSLITCIFRSGELLPTSGNQKDDSVRKPRSAVSVFKDEARVPQTKNCRWPLESRKGKEINSPLEFLEEIQPCQPFVFIETSVGLSLYRTTENMFVLFTGPNLWCFVEAAIEY